MRKLIILMFCMILLVGSISALEFDNRLTYENNDLKVTINDCSVWAIFCLVEGETIGTAELKSHKSVDEIVQYGGGEQVTMYYDLNFEELSVDSLGEVSFTDLNTGKEIERDYSFVYWGDIEVDDYGDVLINDLTNKTPTYKRQIVGSHIEKDWLNYNSKDIPKGEIRIGLKTYVEVGDKVDGIWTIEGKEIEKHAGWSAGLNTSLITYFEFTETTGNLIDEIGTSDLTESGTVPSSTGVVGNSRGVYSVANYFEGEENDSLNMNTSSLFSTSVWFKTTGTSGTSTVMLFGEALASSLEFAIRIIDNHFWGWFLYRGVTNEQYDGGAVSPDVWHNAVIVHNASGGAFYLFLDGVYVTKSTGSYTAGSVSSNNLSIGGYYSGGLTEVCDNCTIDRVHLWSRGLTVAEVLEVYQSGDSVPVVTLNNPVGSYNSILNDVLFNCAVSDNYGILNVSLLIDGVIDQTNTSGVNNVNYTFTKTIADGTYNWTCQAFDNTNQSTIASARTFTISKFIENSQTYNTSTYETKDELFTINVTYDSSQFTSSTATLYYNGTGYTGTKIGSGDTVIFSKSIDIPTVTEITNETFYWTISLTNSTSTYDYDSNTYYQIANPIIFTQCNSTYNTPFINFTFKDEGDLSVTTGQIPTSSFGYWLGDGSVTKNYTYINNINNTYYAFCFSPPNKTLNIDMYVQYKNDNAPQRIYNPAVTTLTNATTNTTLYLLETADGLYVTFQVVNSVGQTISGVDVTAVRTISGSDVTVAQGTTGDDGSVTFWLNPDFSHTFTFTKTGYTTYETTYAPTQSGYTVTLSGGTSTTVSYGRGITTLVVPTNTSLVNGTDYTFGFQLNSSFWDVDDFGFNLRLRNGTIITGGNTATEGTFLTKVYNTGDQTRIYLDYYWVVESNYTNVSIYWNVYNTANTQWSIKTFFTDLTLYMDSGMFGIDDFGRKLFIFLIIFISVGTLGYKYGASDPIFVASIIFGVIFFFDVAVGLIPAYVTSGGREINNLYTFLSGLLLALLALKEVAK